MVQNHQLNHLAPTDLKNLYHLASSEFSLHFTEKTSPVTLTVFLIKLLGNYTRTDRQTHILRLLLRYSQNSCRRSQARSQVFSLGGLLASEASRRVQSSCAAGGANGIKWRKWRITHGFFHFLHRKSLHFIPFYPILCH